MKNQQKYTKTNKNQQTCIQRRIKINKIVYQNNKNQQNIQNPYPPPKKKNLPNNTKTNKNQQNYTSYTKIVKFHTSLFSPGKSILNLRYFWIFETQWA